MGNHVNCGLYDNHGALDFTVMLKLVAYFM